MAQKANLEAILSMFFTLAILLWQLSGFSCLSISTGCPKKCPLRNFDKYLNSSLSEVLEGTKYNLIWWGTIIHHPWMPLTRLDQILKLQGLLRLCGQNQSSTLTETGDSFELQNQRNTWSIYSLKEVEKSKDEFYNNLHNITKENAPEPAIVRVENDEEKDKDVTNLV